MQNWITMNPHPSFQQHPQLVGLNPGPVLQRACACGQHSTNHGVSEDCKKRQNVLQRTAVNSSPVNDVPPIVHEVLRSPGHPLDIETRATLEPRFGYDFSDVRVHTDPKAAESAQAVNALAYTVGRDVVFGTRQYSPNSMVGRKLLTHELTHVVQQNGMPSSLSYDLTMSRPGDASEVEADRASSAVLASQNFSPNPRSDQQLARQGDAGVPGTTPMPASTSAPETTEIVILAWSGSMDIVTWVAGALRVGELDANSIDSLVDAVHAEMRNRPNVRIGRLRIVGHASSGRMSPDLVSYSLTPQARQRLGELNQYFAAGSVVNLEGCQVAAGMSGVTLLQSLSDIWGVPVTAFTDIQNALGLWGAGHQVERRPGQELGTVTDIVVGQIRREIRETSFRTQLRVILRLEEANANGVLNDVISQLRADRTWTEVVDLLTSMHVRFYPDLVDRVNALNLPGVRVSASMISMPHGFPLVAH